MASSLKSVLALLLSGLLVACAVQQADSDWLADIPPRAYFQQHWQQDGANQQLQSEDEYLLWVRRFYTGFNLAPGWFEMMNQVDRRIPADERQAVRKKLSQLGGRIGAEWAKSNKLRKFNTRSAAVWRDALRESLNQADLHAYLDRLEQDVDDLLSGKITNDQIYFERYYVDEFDF